MLFNLLSTAFLALTLSVPDASAAPTWGPPKGSKGIAKLVAKMPKSTLAPPENLELKYVVLGVGTQNYTCLTGDAAAEPVAAGAVGMSSFLHIIVYNIANSSQPNSTISDKL